MRTIFSMPDYRNPLFPPTVTQRANLRLPRGPLSGSSLAVELLRASLVYLQYIPFSKHRKFIFVPKKLALKKKTHSLVRCQNLQPCLQNSLFSLHSRERFRTVLFLNTRYSSGSFSRKQNQVGRWMELTREGWPRRRFRSGVSAQHRSLYELRLIRKCT